MKWKTNVKAASERHWGLTDKDKKDKDGLVCDSVCNK